MKQNEQIIKMKEIIENYAMETFSSIVEHTDTDMFDQEQIDFVVRDMQASYPDGLFHDLPAYALMLCAEMQLFNDYFNVEALAKTVEELTSKPSVEPLDWRDYTNLYQRVRMAEMEVSVSLNQTNQGLSPCADFTKEANND
ncbi:MULTISPECIES: hypothetical protein [Vibrio]|uniref:Uncharacterized protein n=1 Tax=Vibrio aestuarianus TaxID=28171 RepID=A0ABM9FKW4_9VIBR|nr:MULTISPECIES: hypothetical protein [Vibrio]MDE1213224.1 hypothetical protein [Vibrio aestuarianus]MDE1216576.1 hypothetical protein [Vibrio aestuarianus]MDE1255211.1 hypothetical protein [Vibrio aestuarianus]MDE1267075.1 hypothetical protein [Vibrio aestuarianus]MDE1274587.1 hypothetical protein [Vibrio aestuarianus]